MKDTILVETCHFDDPGGWVIDQQFIRQMGNPFLLAHGLGEPVKDAKTLLRSVDPGGYHFWVRTRNWAAAWRKDLAEKDCPGRFKVLINGKETDRVFGTGSKEWAWEYGGTCILEATGNEVALRDLAGFDARCDALVFSKTEQLELPDSPAAFEAFRELQGNKQPAELHEFDFVVVGGGVAGICASVAAARKGLKVALIHDRPILGGNNSSEVRVQLGGKVNLHPYEALGTVVNEIDHKTNRNARPAEEYRDDLKMAVVRAEKNLHLFLNTTIQSATVTDGIIRTISGYNIRNGQCYRFKAALFSDCTGDATLGYLAGADYREGRESKKETGEPLAPDEPDHMTLGTSVMWYSDETDQQQQFPETPWAIPFTEETCQKAKKGDWDWETGIGRNHIEDFEYIRDYGLMAVFGNWSFLKNASSLKEEYQNRKLMWVAYIGGKRESRRLMGDVILSQHDIQQEVMYPDACVTTSWSIDLHEPKVMDQFGYEPFRARARKTRIEPTTIPYRSFYSRNIRNLFMAGRNISVTHVALGAVRVMKTTGMMGEVVGLAAACCIKKDLLPRALYDIEPDYLKDTLKEGVPGRT